MSKRKIFFRADAGADIGYGHFVRTLALADMLKDAFDCVFVTQAPTDYQKAEVAKVCRLIALPATEEKFGQFLDLLQGDETVVLDNYFYTTDYQCQIKAKGCKLVCIDDMHDRHYVADVVVNHALSEGASFSVESYTELCLGPSWALLRSPFREYAVNEKGRSAVGTNRPVKKVVVCFGGVDTWHLTEKITSVLKNVASVKEICSLNNKSKYGAREVADKLAGADMAFVSASTVCLEAMACGTRVAAGYYVDNQKGVYEEYCKHGYILPLGNLLKEDLTCAVESALNSDAELDFPEMGNIAGKYLELFETLSEKNNYYLEGLAFVDYTCLNLQQSVEVWQGRNKEEIRCRMENCQPFTFEEHTQFLHRLKEKSDKVYWAVFEKKSFVGSVNVYYSQTGTCERGIFVLPENMGMGVASRIEKGVTKILRKKGIDKITARVKTTNGRSLNFHLRNHYDLEGRDEEYYYLVKSLSNE